MRFWVVPLLLLAFAAPAAASPEDFVATGTAALERDVSALTDTGAREQAVRGFETSALASTLRYQHRLGGDVGMVNASWLGTHNSFNAIAEMGPALSVLDSNQQLSLVQQLRIGVRSLELDVHLWLGRPVVCHAQGGHEGCSIERSFAEVLAPVAAWVRDHPGEVVLLYAEDHLDTDAGYTQGADALKNAFGARLYTPRGKGCTQLPDALTRDDVLAAGAQVVVVSDCGKGSWPAVAHAWDRHTEGGPEDFTPGACTGFDTKLVRFFEDSTFISATVALAEPASPGDAGITPDLARAMTACGVDLFGFDQVAPGDARLEAVAWSWADGVPARGGCAVSGERWTTGSCAKARPAACRTSAGTWKVSKPTIRRRAARACAKAGGTLAAPRTGYEQALLRAAAGDRKVLLGLDAAWRPLDRR